MFAAPIVGPHPVVASTVVAAAPAVTSAGVAGPAPAPQQVAALQASAPAWVPGSTTASASLNPAAPVWTPAQPSGMNAKAPVFVPKPLPTATYDHASAHLPAGGEFDEDYFGEEEEDENGLTEQEMAELDALVFREEVKQFVGTAVGSADDDDVNLIEYELLHGLGADDLEPEDEEP